MRPLIISKFHRAAKIVFQSGQNLLEAQLWVWLAFRTAKMGEQNNLCPFIRKLQYGWFHRINAGFISDHAILHGQVEIHAHKHDFAFGIQTIKGGKVH